MNHIEKLNRISEVCQGAFHIIYNPHLLPAVTEGKKTGPATTDEYIRIIEKTDHGRAIFVNFGESREIRRHIVQTNKMIEAHFYLDVAGDTQMRYFAHYDLKLLVDEMWGYLELLGKIQEEKLSDDEMLKQIVATKRFVVFYRDYGALTAVPGKEALIYVGQITPELQAFPLINTDGKPFTREQDAPRIKEAWEFMKKFEML